MAASLIAFSLEATEASPWFRLLGRGKVRCELPGTWGGTVTLEKQRPDGTAAVARDQGGSATAFTANPGYFEIEDAGPLRFNFTRVSGTVTPAAWSDESLLDMPFGYEMADGDFWVMEDGDYLQMENG